MLFPYVADSIRVVAISRKAALTVFFGLSWLHMLFQTWPYLHSAVPQYSVSSVALFHLLTWLAYSFIYLLPAVLITWLCGRLVPRARGILALVAVAATVLSLLFIQVDRTIYDLYNFHFNGFVANLLFTPGGLNSLGSGQDTYLGALFIVVRIVALQAALYWLCGRLPVAFAQYVDALRLGRRLVYVALAMALVQSAFYGISDIRNDGAILESARVYPLYKRITFRGLAQNLGFKVGRTEHVNAAIGAGSLRYPRNPVKFAPVERPPNIIMLVSESLRWDQLAPDTMPATWQFAQRAQHFTQHYSSGNGTREGLFGMFYGLYGSYWSTFLYARQPPLLMQRLQELDYQLDLRTSAHFTYPEFDKTLFASVPKQFQHDGDDTLEAWQNDVKNTDGLLQFLENRDRGRPFMSFLFYNATHARYSFPDSSIVKRPYLENLNYAGLSKESLAPHIGELLNRYGNAAHSIDTQMERVIAYLDKNGLLDNTIVIITGDHGEEFMEKGFWGHNSSFVEQQTHTPMVVWMPGKGHAEIDRLSSHMDISTTLLQELGAPVDASEYSLGSNLFDESPRPYIVISDWHSIAVRTADMKYRIPYINHSVDRWVPTRTNDVPYATADAAHILEKNRADILGAIKNCSRFYAGKEERQLSQPLLTEK
jgi:membrane-anchored protein YejM (alkaline phosphatase superfamily)